MKDKRPLCCKFCYYSIAKTFFSKQLQFLSDENELLQAEDLLHKKFPTFNVHLDEYLAFLLHHLLKFRIILSQNKQKPHNNKFTANKVNVSRFPVVSNEAIQELSFFPENKYT